MKPLGNAAEPGYHLAIILEKEHHPTEAMAQLDLAASGEPGANAAGVQKLIADEQSTLLKSGAPLPAKNARLSLQDQRTYSLARGKVTTTGQGWATVELELTAQGANAVRIVQGDDSLQPLTDTIQHLNLDLKIPPDSHANLVRRGVLSCHTSTTCQLVLVPPQSALNP